MRLSPSILPLTLMFFSAARVLAAKSDDAGIRSFSSNEMLADCRALVQEDARLRSQHSALE